MQFEKYESGWDLDCWKTHCPEMTYKVISQNEIPNWLPKALTNKFNSAVIASSGNTSTYVGIILGFRIDKSEIDEHPFVVAFDKKNKTQYSGWIHHGNYPDRTTDIPIEMQELIASSGLTVNFKFERKPNLDFGTLEDLKNQGIFTGYEKSVSIIERKRTNN